MGATTITTTCEEYDTTNGQAASTTGNIYGVYDMSGGTIEYVMGNMANWSGSFYAGDESSFSPAEKYYDAYTYYESGWYTEHGRGKLGDATKETLKTFGDDEGGWYNDGATYPNGYAGYPWFTRSGHSMSGANSGLFNFNNTSGGPYGSAASSRIVMSRP